MGKPASRILLLIANAQTPGAWQLDEKSSAVVVLDKDGRVQWAKDRGASAKGQCRAHGPVAYKFT